MATTRLSDHEIASRLDARSEWSQPGEEIQRTFRFGNFLLAMEFVGAIAAHVEHRIDG